MVIAELLSALAELQKSERVRVSAEARDWSESLKASRAALSMAGLDEKQASFSQSAAEAIGQIPSMGLFDCQLLHRFLETSKNTIRQAAVAHLEAELQRRLALVEQRKAECEAAETQKAVSVSAAIEHKRRVIEDVNEQRAILNNRGDSIQQGCACGLILACVVLAGYLAYNFVLAFTGRKTQIAEPLNVLFLTLFVLPVSVTLIAQMVYSMKRFMVESEFKTRIHQATVLCEKAIEQAENRHRSVEPGLKQRLDQAAAGAEKVKEALRSLGISTDPPQTELSPPDNV